MSASFRSRVVPVGRAIEFSYQRGWVGMHADLHDTQREDYYIPV